MKVAINKVAKIIEVTATVIVETGDTTNIKVEPLQIKTKRNFLVSPKMRKTTPSKLAMEALEVYLVHKYSKMVAFEILSMDFKIIDKGGFTGSRVAIWVKNYNTNKVRKFKSLKDAVEGLDFSYNGFLEYARKTRAKPVTSSYKKIYGVSFDGKNFSGHAESLVLEDAKLVMKELGKTKAKPVIAMSTVTGEVREYKSLIAAARAHSLRGPDLCKLCYNVAINRTNVGGIWAFWFKSEYIPGVSKPQENLERTYHSIRVLRTDVDTGEKKIYRTIQQVIDELGLSTNIFETRILNRKYVWQGYVYDTLGSSCALPKYA
ncbi:MAG: hypothetical protein IBX57_00675 [Gammaproteobacteria bacterium]|nr:hypothetical protein [Gammaproteobacteria bacterium]